MEPLTAAWFECDARELSLFGRDLTRTSSVEVQFHKIASQSSDSTALRVFNLNHEEAKDTSQSANVFDSKAHGGRSAFWGEHSAPHSEAKYLTSTIAKDPRVVVAAYECKYSLAGKCAPHPLIAFIPDYVVLPIPVSVSFLLFVILTAIDLIYLTPGGQLAIQRLRSRAPFKRSPLLYAIAMLTFGGMCSATYISYLHFTSFTESGAKSAPAPWLIEFFKTDVIMYAIWHFVLPWLCFVWALIIPFLFPPLDVLGEMSYAAVSDMISSWQARASIRSHEESVASAA